ncbi:hypothetical protein V6N13_091187 [Hibiscus sabdariffa]
MKDKGEVTSDIKRFQKAPRKETVWERGESNKEDIKARKRINGHVEAEDLWKMRRCLVCSIRSIEMRLQAWGLGASKTFLIFINDDDLFLMLEDLQWSYLKEIFVDLVYEERATWLDLSSFPIHCWNDTTLKRLSKLWGNFEAPGENTAHMRDCEKVTILITTHIGIADIIEEVVDIYVRQMLHHVRVIELGFNDTSMEFNCGENSVNPRGDKDEQRDVSVSESTSDSSDKLTPIVSLIGE